jgi:hypothetical protein
MSQDDKNTPNLPFDQQDGLLAGPAAVADGGASVTSIAADRLYQLAAVTAGIFLLVTLL